MPTDHGNPWTYCDNPACPDCKARGISGSHGMTATPLTELPVPQVLDPTLQPQHPTPPEQ